MRDVEWDVGVRLLPPELLESLTEIAKSFNSELDDCFSEAEVKSMSKLDVNHLVSIINALDVMLDYDDVITPSRDKFLLEDLFDRLEKLNKANTPKRINNGIVTISTKLQEYEKEIGSHRKWLNIGINKALSEYEASNDFMCCLKKKIKEIEPRQNDQKFRAAIELVATKVYQAMCPSSNKCKPMPRKDIKKNGKWLIRFEDEKYAKDIGEFYSKLNHKRKNRFKVLFKSMCTELELVGKGKLFNSDSLLEKQLQSYFIKK